MNLRTLLIIFTSLSIITSCATNEGVPSVDQTQSSGLYNQEYGVQAYSFRNYFPRDMIGTLDRISEMGITKIEGDGGRIPPEEFRRLCADRGISIPSTGCSFQELEQNPQAIIDKAKKLGASYVMCAWIPHDGDFTLGNAQRAVEVFNSAGKVMAEQGITFTYHAHGYEFQKYQQGTLLDYLFEHTNPQHVSFEMDIFWMHFGGGDPVKLMKKYGDRWKLMHLKDMKKGTTKNLTGLTDVETNVPLGTGELDIPAIIREGNRIGIEHYFIEDESSVVVKQIPKTIAYLRSLR